MAEHQQPLIERLADLESDVRALMKQIDQLQRDPKLVPPQAIEWVKTQGETIDGGYYEDTTNYPDQDVDAPECELPAVFLRGACPEALADPFVWTPRSATPQTKIISPGGWIPETVHPIPVARMRDGRYHVLWLPELRVVANETIAADTYGECSLWLFGVDTEIDFQCWNDWLEGGNAIESGKECLARLDWDVRRWSLSAGVEC